MLKNTGKRWNKYGHWKGMGQYVLLPIAYSVFGYFKMADFCQFRICIIKGVGQETGADRTMLHVTSRTSKYWSLILYLIFVKYIPPHVYKTHSLLGQVEQTLYVNCTGEFDFAILTNNEPHVIGCFSYFCNIFVWIVFFLRKLLLQNF